MRELKVLVRGTGEAGHDKNYYELRTLERPTRTQIREAQVELGFPPSGYEGPHNISSKNYLWNSNGRRIVGYVTVWTSRATCD